MDTHMESHVGAAGQHPQTRDAKCVYHGTRCLVPCDGEIVCRLFGNVVGRVEESDIAHSDSHEFPSARFGAGAVSESLGTASPKIGGKARKVYTKYDGDRIWRYRIGHIADHFGIGRSVRSEIEFVFSQLRRKTNRRPSHILFFAVYNTCRERGACVVSEHELRKVMCHCCNLQSMHSALKIYGMFAVEARRLGLYSGHNTSGFYFNTFLNTTARALDLDESDRQALWRKAHQRYLLLPASMSEKYRTRSTFRAVLGKRVFESIKGEVKY